MRSFGEILTHGLTKQLQARKEWEGVGGGWGRFAAEESAKAKDWHCWECHSLGGLGDKTGVDRKGIYLTELVTTNMVLGIDWRYTDHRNCWASQQETHWPSNEDNQALFTEHRGNKTPTLIKVLKTNKRAVLS